MIREIKEFLNSVDFGNEIFKDYYGTGNEAGYKQDLKRFTDAKKEAMSLLAQLGTITESEMAEACKRAFMGRVKWHGTGRTITYTAGQFYDLEIPQAMQGSA